MDPGVVFTNVIAVNPGEGILSRQGKGIFQTRAEVDVRRGQLEAGAQTQAQYSCQAGALRETIIQGDLTTSDILSDPNGACLKAVARRTLYVARFLRPVQRFFAQT